MVFPHWRGPWIRVTGESSSDSVSSAAACRGIRSEALGRARNRRELFAVRLHLGRVLLRGSADCQFTPRLIVRSCVGYLSSGRLPIVMSGHRQLSVGNSADRQIMRRLSVEPDVGRLPDQILNIGHLSAWGWPAANPLGSRLSIVRQLTARLKGAPIAAPVRSPTCLAALDSAPPAVAGESAAKAAVWAAGKRTRLIHQFTKACFKVAPRKNAVLDHLYPRTARRMLDLSAYAQWLAERFSERILVISFAAPAPRITLHGHATLSLGEFEGEVPVRLDPWLHLVSLYRSVACQDIRW